MNRFNDIYSYFSHRKTWKCSSIILSICFLLLRWIMSNRPSQNALPERSAINTQTFLHTCVLDADYKALKEHLERNHVEQGDLDRCLLRGLQIVQSNPRELSHVAQTLTTLLEFGAKWNCSILLDIISGHHAIKSANHQETITSCWI